MVVFAPFAPTYTPEPLRCSGGVKSGTAILQEWICEASPWADELYDLGTYVCRFIAGTTTLTQHAAGRAGDDGLEDPADDDDVSAAQALASWLVANSPILGIQEVIWNRRRWTNQTHAWVAYHGEDPHTGHVHWALNSSGATYLTLARVLSVAPTDEGDLMPALTEVEQRDLYARIKAIDLRSVATLNGVDDAKPLVIRRQGSSGMSTVSIRFGNLRMPIKTLAAFTALKTEYGQTGAQAMPKDAFDALHVLQ